MKQAIDFINKKIADKAAELHGLEWAIQQAEEMDDAATIADLQREFDYIETERYALIETRYELEQIAGIVPVDGQHIREYLEKGAVA